MMPDWTQDSMVVTAPPEGERLERKSEGADPRLDAVAARFDRLDARLDALDARQNRVERKIDRILHHLAGHRS
jgi:hypothetical protein